MNTDNYLNVFVPSIKGEYLISGKKCNKVVFYGNWDDDFALSKMEEIKGIAFKVIKNKEVISEHYK
jgi:nitrate reductase beta subunit